MAFDWSKLSYSDLLKLAQTQDPSISAGYQIPSRDAGIDPNTGSIDLSSLGLPSNAGVTADAYGRGLIFNMPDPNGSGHRVAIRPGANGGVDTSYYNQGDSLLDKMIPLGVALGGGLVGANALGLIGSGAAGGTGVATGGAIGSGASSIPADISGSLLGSAPTLSMGDIAALAPGMGTPAAAAGAGALGAGIGGAGGGAAGAADMGGFVPGTGAIGSGAASIPANMGAGGALPTLSAADIGSAGGPALAGTSGLSGLLGTAQDFLGSPLGKLGTTLLGGLIGSQPNQQSSNMSKQIDPRMVPYVYGQGGVLPAAAALYNSNPSGINDLMRQGWQTQLAALNNPAVRNGFQNMMNMGNSLLGGSVAANPFTSGQASLTGIPSQFRATLGG